jgi:hypothetical protein
MSLLLRHVVERHESALLPLVDSVGGQALTDTDREALRSVVLSEFLSSGRGPDDEPNRYGLELEDLIDALGHC